MLPLLLLFVEVGAFATQPQTAPGAEATPRPAACIAIGLPSVQGVEGDATAVGGSVRELVASFLRGPSMEVVLLDARLPAHALDEAKQKQCGHVVTVTVTRKRGSGGGFLGQVVGQAGSSVAWGIPGGNVGTAVARGVAVAATQAISELASSTKAKDEVRLDFTLTSADGRTVLGPKSEKGKAKSDGEDLLTPLVQRAAEAIVSAVK